MNTKKVVIFTGKYSRASTIEHVEAIARVFPNWSVCILQEFPRRRWRPYLKGKVKQLLRQPISYPLELLSKVASLALRRLHCGRSHGGPAPSPGAVHLPESLASIAFPNVTYRSCSSLHAQETVRFVQDQGFWLGLSIGAPILRPKLFKLPELGTLNIHKSLLPSYRGMPPGFWELHDGAAKTGVSVHWVEAGLDTGDILCQRELPIPPFSTVRGLQVQLDALGTEVLLDALHQVEVGRWEGAPQVQTDRPPNRQPAWLRSRALHGRLRRRRQPNRSLAACLRHAAKTLVLVAYVYAYAPARNRLRSRRGRNHTVVLLYHRVNDGYLDSVTVGVEQFDRWLSIIKEHYDVLDLKTFLASREGNQSRPSVLITFDDGYQDNYLAAILLRRHGLPCTFFVSTGIVGTDRPFPHDLKLLGHHVPALTGSRSGKWLSGASLSGITRWTTRGSRSCPTRTRWK